jgi:hypothetical protein
MDDEDDNTGGGTELKFAICCKTPATSSSDGLRLRRFGLDGEFSCQQNGQKETGETIEIELNFPQYYYTAVENFCFLRTC